MSCHHGANKPRDVYGVIASADTVVVGKRPYYAGKWESLFVVDGEDSKCLSAARHICHPALPDVLHCASVYI